MVDGLGDAGALGLGDAVVAGEDGFAGGRGNDEGAEVFALGFDREDEGVVPADGGEGVDALVGLGGGVGFELRC